MKPFLLYAVIYFVFCFVVCLHGVIDILSGRHRHHVLTGSRMMIRRRILLNVRVIGLQGSPLDVFIVYIVYCKPICIYV